MSKKTEQKFITELKKSIELFHEQMDEPYFWYKIPDNPHMGVARFDLPKPFDILYVVDSQPYCIEAKAMNKYRAFSLRDIRPSQVEYMTAFDDAGGVSYVFLNVRQAASKAEGIEYVNKLIVMQWATLYPRLLDSSIKAKELRDAPGITGSKGLFDLSKGFIEYDPTVE